MISFTIVLFFSVTGLTLNHADKFQGGVKTTQAKGKLDSSWVNSKDTLAIPKLTIVEYFRKNYPVKGAVSDFRIDDYQINLAFRAPGYEAAIFIDRVSGNFELTQTSAGWIGFINDLHKGRDTGSTWSWVIDISAVLMVLISLTGIILLLYIKRKRLNGILLVLLGTLLLYLVYRIWGQ
ncbi:MAG: PepSY-associated TM helix domain-containing protein [Bacteroidota bacterium]|nr:PepSY-associated TM helix domain-containing protein [Bacteroidota bacterium]